MGIKGVSTDPEPEKEEEKVSPRQGVLDHVFLGFAGLLFVVSGTLFFLRARKRRQAGKGIFGGEGYEMVGNRAA
jgi:FK506-binding protein 2